MLRRAFTLVEILAAMVVFVIVGSMGFYVLSSQNREWKTESDKTSVQMMAKSTLDELSRAVRMTGAGLPDNAGGMLVASGGPPQVTFVMNDDGGTAIVKRCIWDPASKTLRIEVDSATKLAFMGYARLELKVPPLNPVHPATPNRTMAFTLPVSDRMSMVTGGCGDSIILDGSRFLDSGWTYPGEVQAFDGGPVQNIDSVRYRQGHDTLFVQRNRQQEVPYAYGVDTLKFGYFHPVDGWMDALSSTAPANKVTKVRIRLVLRTTKVDSKLLAQDSSSRGYYFAKMETEVGIRASELVNK